jgi:hypothetical protein
MSEAFDCDFMEDMATDPPGVEGPPSPPMEPVDDDIAVATF